MTTFSMSSPSSTAGKFEAFEQHDYIYSTVKGHELGTTLLTPKNALESLDESSTPIPVLVFWHGGGFITGHRLYEPWWPTWLLEFSQRENAVIIAPDYRLLPEATGVDILEDMDAFWNWYNLSLPTLLTDQPWSGRVDLAKLVCAGQSAGGSIAMHSALDRPDIPIKAVISLSAALTVVPELKMVRPRQILGAWPPPPPRAEAKIRAYIQQSKGTIRSSDNPVEMWDLLTCLVQQGWVPRLVHKKPDPRLATEAAVERCESVPPLWIVHGQDDSVVSSVNFVARFPLYKHSLTCCCFLPSSCL